MITFWTIVAIGAAWVVVSVVVAFPLARWMGHAGRTPGR